MTRSIAVIGNGFVGGSLTTVFAERGFDVYVYDKAGNLVEGGQELCVKDPEGFTHWSYERPVRSASELAVACEGIELTNLKHAYDVAQNFSGIYFVCLPTPMKKDGSCDTSIVEGTLRELASVPGERTAVVKSTVPPGSVERWNAEFAKDGLHVIFNPEFLREATALDDMRNQDRIIIGGPRPHVDRVRDLFRMVFPDVPIHKTASTIAELVKYTTNTFLATKVSFANELYQIVEALQNKGMDVDYDRMVELARLDPRLGDSHWQVPGPMPADDGSGRLLRGFAGSCFVKDLNELVHLAREVGVDPKVMVAAWEKNLEVRPERDWENLKGRAVADED